MNTEMLLNILEDKGFNVNEAAGGMELVISCPLCWDERQRLYISAENGLWICHRCEAKGHLRRLLINVCEMTPNEAFPWEKKILQGLKLRKWPLVSRPAAPATVTMPSECLQADQPQSVRLAESYFESRGLKRVWVGSLRVGTCLTGFFHHRVIVPVITQGQLRTFVARTWLEDEKKKVLMPKGSQAERALFGYDELFTERAHWSNLIVVEGVFDAIRMWEIGYRETVATLGAHITELQRVLMRRLKPDRVILLRDGDKAGREAALKEARELAADFLPVSIAHLPDGTDPGNVEPAVLRAALAGATPVGEDYGIETMKEENNG